VNRRTISGERGLANRQRYRASELSAVHGFDVFLVNPSAIVLPAQNRSAQQTACD
jgi:hypothetical protein